MVLNPIGNRTNGVTHLETDDYGKTWTPTKDLQSSEPLEAVGYRQLGPHIEQIRAQLADLLDHLQRFCSSDLKIPEYAVFFLKSNARSVW